jgi:ferric-dicitrate binding protein FerR (iron transport regulator)
MNEESPTNALDDTDLAALLAAAGPRTLPSPQAMASVRAAVEAEWRATLAARQRRHRFTSWAAAAGVAAAALAVWIAQPLRAPDGVVVASLTRVVGDVQQNSGDGRWIPLDAAGSLETGTQLRTGTGGQAALRLDDGVELRLDSRTLVVFEDSQRARLERGAVYLDSHAEPGRAPADFTLATPIGTVRHLGTQYQARIANEDLRVAIREGRVQVGTKAGDVQGAAGEQLTIGDGRVERSELAAHAADWNWLATITPPFSLEGRSVDAFLAWAGRETGRTVVYGSPDVEQQARAVILSGTLEGLTPDEAVAAVLSTTSLQAALDGDRIRIEAATR